MCSTLLQLGPFTLKAFGLMMALGFGCAWYAAARLSRGTHRTADYLSSLIVWMMVAGVLGARLAYVAEHWTQEFASRPAAILRIDQGGLMFYGGVAGAVLTLFLFARLRHEPFLGLADLLAAVLPVGHFFGRIGCFLNGCCHGRPSDSFLAVSYPAHSPAWYAQLDAGRITEHATRSLPVLPTQLFEAGANLLLFLLLYRLYRRASARTGLVTAVYFLAYPVIRFMDESLRGDVRMNVGSWSIGQFLSLLLFAAGAVLLARCLRSGTRPQAPGAR
jgi:phosphatidylglycerol:prolipoprotein diacylglycerol transferase